MWLFEQTDTNRDIGERASAIAHATGLTLKLQAQRFIDLSLAHFHTTKDGLGSALERRNGPGRTCLAALHAQDAGLFTRHNIWRVQ